MKIFDVKACKKKASLNLSINAIVVLILAITMLGLGLGFIRSMFKGATGKLSGAIESTSLKNPADSNTPLTIDRQISLKANTDERIEVGYYNTYTQTNFDVKLSLISCDDPVLGVGNEDDPEGAKVTLRALPATEVPAGESTGYNAILSAESGTDTGTYICQIKAKGNEVKATQTQQFFLEIV